MLELESFGNKISISGSEIGYAIEFTISYDSDNDDTVSYSFQNEGVNAKVSELVKSTELYQLLTENIDVELLIGATKIGTTNEAFFSLVDYATEEKFGTAKTYSIFITRYADNFDVLKCLVSLIKEDMEFSKKGLDDNEHKLNTP